MRSILLTLLFAAVPIAAHSESHCIIPKRAPTFALERATAAGHFTATRNHSATSTSPASETQYQLWLLASGEALVQRESWPLGEYQKRSTGILRGRWSVERGYVVVLYGSYCETLQLVTAPEASNGQQLKSIHARPSSAWLMGKILSRTTVDTPAPR